MTTNQRAVAQRTMTSADNIKATPITLQKYSTLGLCWINIEPTEPKNAQRAEIRNMRQSVGRSLNKTGTSLPSTFSCGRTIKVATAMEEMQAITRPTSFERFIYLWFLLFTLYILPVSSHQFSFTVSLSPPHLSLSHTHTHTHTHKRS